MANGKPAPNDTQFLQDALPPQCPYGTCQQMKMWRVIWGGFIVGYLAVAGIYGMWVGGRIDDYSERIKETEKQYKEQMAKIDGDNRSISESIARMEERLATNIQYLRDDIKAIQAKINR